MPLPHFTQLLMTGSPGGPGTTPDEAVYLNLFEITFVFPLILQAQGRDPILMLQQTGGVSLNTTEEIEYAEQRFKYSTRVYPGTPKKTHIEFDLDFNINQNSTGSMNTWNTMKAWYDLVWNAANGSLHYKSDIIGTIIVNHHDRKGLIIRRWTLQNAMIKGLDGIDLKWESSAEIYKSKAKFVSDYWVEEIIDTNFVIAPPLITGY